MIKEIETLIKQRKFSEAKQFLELNKTNDLKKYLYFFYLSLIHKAEGLKSQALTYLDQSITANPEFINAHIVAGEIYDRDKNYPKSIEHLKIANHLDSHNDKIFYLLGRAFYKNKQFEEAINTLNFIKSDFKKNEILLNLAVSYSKLNFIDKAIKCYEQLIVLKKNDIDLLLTLGSLFVSINENKKALHYYGRAHKLNKYDYRPYLATSKILHNGKKSITLLEEAYRHAINIKPHIFYELILRKAQICDWSFWDNELSNLTKLFENNIKLRPFGTFFLADDPAVHQKIAKRNWDQFEKNIVFNKPTFNYKNKKIKIGYVSPDIKGHAVMYISLGLFKYFNKNDFEIYSYSIFKNDESWERETVKKHSNYFFDIDKMDIKTILKLITSHQIDILVDMAGYTKNTMTEIFLYKPAPIIINYLGYPGTMGSNTYDYIVSDKNSLPEKSTKYVDEKIIYLPHTYFTYFDGIEVEKNYTKKDFELPEDKVLLCCFNNVNKITPVEFSIWMRILKNNDNAVIVFKSQDTKEVKENLQLEAKKRDVNPHRLYFIKNLPHIHHLATYRLMDIFLDTFNFNAHTTALESLYMGVPLITKQGNGIVSRAASGILCALGLDDLVTKNAQEYENLINHYVAHPNKLNSLKNRVKNHKKQFPLFNSKLYVKNLETAYRKIYEVSQKNEPPRNIFIT